MGWIVVRDALTMGPYAGADSVTPHTRPPADEDGDHMLVRTIECIEGRVEIEVICEPAFDYGRTPAEWTMAADDLHTADATGAGQTFRLLSDLALGIEGNRVRGRHVLQEGERAFCCMTWAEGLAGPRSVEEAEERMAATTRFWRGLARARTDPRPPLARPDPALGAGDQGPDLHADRRDRGSAHDLAARDARAASATGTTATRGCATRPSRCRRCTG